MRAALGVLFLVLLCVAATLVQERWIDGVRDRLPGLQLPAQSEVRAAERQNLHQSGWARLVVGRPSGADPIVLPHLEAPVYTEYSDAELESSSQQPRRAMISGGEARFEPEFTEENPRPSDFEITLDASSTLSEVCVRFYGSGSPKLYQRLAEYNGLPNPNAIRSGQKLFVPATRELLFEER